MDRFAKHKRKHSNVTQETSVCFQLVANVSFNCECSTFSLSLLL